MAVRKDHPPSSIIAFFKLHAPILSPPAWTLAVQPKKNSSQPELTASPSRKNLDESSWADGKGQWTNSIRRQMKQARHLHSLAPAFFHSLFLHSARQPGRL